MHTYTCHTYIYMCALRGSPHTPPPLASGRYVYIYIYVYVCMYVCMYVCIYIYIIYISLLAGVRKVQGHAILHRPHRCIECVLLSV